jgi:threonine synthase
MLSVRYDLPKVAAAVTKDDLLRRPPGMYRFRELTPLAPGEVPITLGEGGTPLIPLPRLAAHLGLRHVWGKDEGQNPTGSFKARGLGMALTKARTLGVKGLMIPSAATRAAPRPLRRARRPSGGRRRPTRHRRGRDRGGDHRGRVRLHGGRIHRDGGQAHRGHRVQDRLVRSGHPQGAVRLEGKKTMGLELAEQLGWQAPDVLMYPTGGGTGLVGIWKAYEELAAMGWIKTAQPRFVAVQAEGCAPLVKAWHDKAETTTLWENPVTDAPGLRVPGPFAGRQMLRIMRDTGGHARAVSEQEIVEAQKLLARVEGIWTAPEAAAALAALCQMKETGDVDAASRTVIVLTGAGIKNSPPALPAPVHLEGDEAQILARVRKALGL